MSRLHYLFLGLFLFALIHLPGRWTDLWRSQAAATLAPAWRSVLPATSRTFSRRASDTAALQAEVDALQEWLREEKRLQELSAQVAALLGASPDKLKGDLQRRVERQKQILEQRYLSMPAQVIFRDPSCWSSVLWIALGEADNRAVGRITVARNSPVLLGNSLIGVVEYVGESQSRVRLITDAGLIVAVRSSRGGAQNGELAAHVQNLLERIRTRLDLFSSLEEQQRFIDLLSLFQERLQPAAEEELLAKGELSGCSAPLWRSRGSGLKGSGFNYDYADAEGSARDLRTGRPFGLNSGAPKPLIKEGDLLVTSGLDGIFPPGIPVAIAKMVKPLSEGSCTYDLEAIPAAGDLHNLQTLFVLPPLGSTEH